jgi:hypothetical protein
MMRGNYCVDAYGSVIRKASYGKQSEYGWEIDHIRPIAHGGTHDISNLRPLYWEHNRTKGDSLRYVPKIKCGISRELHNRRCSESEKLYFLNDILYFDKFIPAYEWKSYI